MENPDNPSMSLAGAPFIQSHARALTVEQNDTPPADRAAAAGTSVSDENTEDLIYRSGLLLAREDASVEEMDRVFALCATVIVASGNNMVYRPFCIDAHRWTITDEARSLARPLSQASAVRLALMAARQTLCHLDSLRYQSG